MSTRTTLLTGGSMQDMVSFMLQSSFNLTSQGIAHTFKFGDTLFDDCGPALVIEYEENGMGVEITGRPLGEHFDVIETRAKIVDMSKLGPGSFVTAPESWSGASPSMAGILAELQTQDDALLRYERRRLPGESHAEYDVRMQKESTSLVRNKPLDVVVFNPPDRIRGQAITVVMRHGDDGVDVTTVGEDYQAVLFALQTASRRYIGELFDMHTIIATVRNLTLALESVTDLPLNGLSGRVVYERREYTDQGEGSVVEVKKTIVFEDQATLHDRYRSRQDDIDAKYTRKD